MPTATPTRPWRAWYSTARWYRLRSNQLRSHPLCAICQLDGHVTAATIVDHITTHKGDTALFWDSTNLQSLCKQHHDATKQKQEHVGYAVGCDAYGNPIDPKHGWQQK